MTYVVDDQSLFFYAGIIDETRVDRKGYRILAKFINNDNGEIGNVELSPADSDNKMKFQIGKDDYGKEVTPTYSVTETMDPRNRISCNRFFGFRASDQYSNTR